MKSSTTAARLRPARVLIELAPYLASALGCVAIGAGVLVPLPEAGPGQLAALVALLGLVGLYAVGARLGLGGEGRRARHQQRGLVPALHTQRGVLLLAVAAHVLLAVTGGLTSALFPLLVFLVAHRAAVGRHAGLAWAVTGFVWALDGLHILGAAPGSVDGAASSVLLHGGLLALGAVLGRRWGATGGSKGKTTQQGEPPGRLREEARALRLLAAGAADPAAGQHGTARTTLAEHAEAGAAGIRRSLNQQLRILRDALGLHTCALYWLDEQRERLELLEACSASQRLGRRPLAVGEGVPGTVAMSGQAVVLHGLRRDDRALLHYDGGERVAALIAVPVCDGDRLGGVLLGDRRHDLPFAPSHQAVFEAAAELIAATLRNERVFLALQRDKRDQELFHKALKSLNRAQDAGSARQAALHALREVAPYHLAALTLYDAAQDRHQIVAIDGAERIIAPLRGRSFSGRGLVPQAVRTQICLPVDGRVAESAPAVFSEDLRVHGVRSLLVLPLPCGGEVLGTLVLASQDADAYDESVRSRLEVVAHSAAVTLKNAERFELIRRMATIDGLTGLFNHRQFQVRYEESIARAKRSGQPLAVLLMDIDHFKAVNDTYGHPAGDEVLRGVAARLAETVREVDLVARYGGEEFVALLEGCGTEGAMAMGERIREAIAGSPLPAGGGQSLDITLSLGVACFPLHGEHREALLEHADQALYSAKRGGRNRVRLYECPADVQRSVG